MLALVHQRRGIAVRDNLLEDLRVQRRHLGQGVVQLLYILGNRIIRPLAFHLHGDRGFADMVGKSLRRRQNRCQPLFAFGPAGCREQGLVQTGDLAAKRRHIPGRADHRLNPGEGVGQHGAARHVGLGDPAIRQQDLIAHPDNAGNLDTASRSAQAACRKLNLAPPVAIGQRIGHIAGHKFGRPGACLQTGHRA